jgi:hypothetical protein
LGPQVLAIGAAFEAGALMAKAASAAIETAVAH